jgi:rod shape-determining protein MreB
LWTLGAGRPRWRLFSWAGLWLVRSLRIAGDELSDDIIQYAREQFNLQIGERTAENIKIAIGSATTMSGMKDMPMRGRDLVTGLPKEIMVTPEQVRQALAKSVREIVEAVKITIEETPPELVADIMDGGFILAGGGALLKGLDTMLARETKMPVHIAEDPLTAVARGTGLVLEDIDALKEVLVPTQYGKIPRGDGRDS